MTGFCPTFPCSPGDLFHFSGLILTGGQFDSLFRRLPLGILSYQPSTSAFRRLATEQVVALNPSQRGELSTISAAQSNETFSALILGYQQFLALSCSRTASSHEVFPAALAVFFSRRLFARSAPRSAASRCNSASHFSKSFDASMSRCSLVSMVNSA